MALTTDQQVANYVQTTLASPMLSTDASMNVVSAAGMPTTGKFRCVIKDAAPATTFEIVEVASVSGTTLTLSGGAGVGRGLENTTAIAHSTGATVGNDLTAYMLLARFPWGALGYAQVTANQTGITTQVDVTGLSVTVTVGTGRRIKITAYTAAALSTVTTDNCEITINEGATQLSQANTIGGNGGAELLAQVVIQPSAGSHTYKVTALRALGTGSMTFSANANYPGFILVEDIGV